MPISRLRCSPWGEVGGNHVFLDAEPYGPDDVHRAAWSSGGRVGVRWCRRNDDVTACRDCTAMRMFSRQVEPGNMLVIW